MNGYIGPDSARQIKGALYVEGETSIFGQIKRVGGVTALRCSLRIPSQDGLLYCRVAGADLSRKLGKYLYQEVVLHGKAMWLRSDWSVVRFVIRGVERPRQGKLVDAFNQVREAGGSDWEAISDPGVFLSVDGGEE